MNPATSAVRVLARRYGAEVLFEAAAILLRRSASPVPADRPARPVVDVDVADAVSGGGKEHAVDCPAGVRATLRSGCQSVTAQSKGWPQVQAESIERARWLARIGWLDTVPLIDRSGRPAKTRAAALDLAAGRHTTTSGAEVAYGLAPRTVLNTLYKWEREAWARLAARAAVRPVLDVLRTAENDPEAAALCALAATVHTRPRRSAIYRSRFGRFELVPTLQAAERLGREHVAAELGREHNLPQPRSEPAPEPTADLTRVPVVAIASGPAGAAAGEVGREDGLERAIAARIARDARRGLAEAQALVDYPGMAWPELVDTRKGLTVEGLGRYLNEVEALAETDVAAADVARAFTAQRPAAVAARAAPSSAASGACSGAAPGGA